MQNIAVKMAEVMGDESNDLRYLLFRGTLRPMGKKPACEFQFSKNGNPYFRGNVCAETTYGDDKTSRTFMPIVAFGDEATKLAALTEGARIAVLAEYQNQKGQDGKWYTQGVVVASDILDEQADEHDGLPF
jgi:hypothetical protein